MGLYSDYIFPRLMDWACRRMNDLRADGLASAHGDVLEVGFGTGLNLRYYPPAVGSLTGVDPIRAPEKRVASRIAAVRFPVERVALPADHRLPFEAGRFDCVVSTWTLCSIDELEKALEEIRRVLKPGGLFLFIEHGRSPNPRFARWQKRLNPIQKLIGCGCRLDRVFDDLVTKAGFNLTRFDCFLPEGGSPLHEQIYRGVATP